MLERIARTSYRHRWVVLIAWIVTLVLAVGVGRAFAGDFATGGKLPNTESRPRVRPARVAVPRTRR